MKFGAYSSESFYAAIAPSVVSSMHCGPTLVEEFRIPRSRENALPVDLAIDAMASIPMLIILDGLRGLARRPRYGILWAPSLVDLALRQFLVAACHLKHQGLIVLTSRFPFRDLAQYFGRSHRTLPLDRLLDEEGAALLANCGVEGIASARMQVSRKLEGHPLAIRVFAAALATQADRDPTRLLNVLFDKSSMDGKAAALCKGK